MVYYRCNHCGFEIDVDITPVPSNGFEGLCPKCTEGILISLNHGSLTLKQKDKYFNKFKHHIIIKLKDFIDQLDRLH